MSVVSMSGNDTFTINNRLLTGLADGTVVELTYSADIANVKTGKNGNSIYGLNETGRQVDVKLRLIRGCTDDKFLQQLLALQLANFAGFPLMIANFTKQIGDGKGNITSDIYVMSGGVFTKQVEAKSSVEGDTEQSVSMYTMKFTLSPRAIT